jgi:hypothetical protein
MWEKVNELDCDLDCDYLEAHFRRLLFIALILSDTAPTEIRHTKKYFAVDVMEVFSQFIEALQGWTQG